ncbi:MAG: hypothetical protein J7604_10495 [Sporocytophaga sp.]|uniref:hypothetical protein n=1 Tax=Sporocytophaga sp. TaxID=2231183 RepID=UPI001B1F69D7|nr:hypothetical protein [Sporocytophaga sp.]MBO9700627.1 hypothetical protein [Sporocytophaga sp.]
MRPEDKIKTKNKSSISSLEKPFIPHAPGSFVKDDLDPESPNPESNPNYSYMPAIAYPDGIPNFNLEGE